jgi:protein-disulfide isomerase
MHRNLKMIQHSRIYSIPLTFLIALLNFLPVTASQSETLAVLNDRTVTLNDVDPSVREMASRLDSEIEATRTRILDEKIDQFLFKAEARRRRISIDRLVALEVTGRIQDPTPEQILSIYDANRGQFGNTDVAAARPQIVAYLRRESAQRLATELAAGLRKRHAVVMGVNINSPDLAPTATLATVAGKAITAGPVLARLKPLIYDLRARVYEAVLGAVEQLIFDLLVVDEAQRKAVGAEVIIRREITDKLRAPAEAEVVKFYEENRSRIAGDLSSARGAIVSYLEQQERTRLENALRAKLKSGANVRILLPEPVAPVIDVSTDDDPSRGPATAPVTVVVFTDFQCPSCGASHPVIDDITRSFGNNVRLVIRDFPLDIHENARRAAEAANAAHAQGKFFEYMDVLFKNQKSLDIASLKKYATQIGLNRTRFDAALDSGAYRLEVENDINDGTQYGIAGTPTVFVNGVRVNKLSAETLRAAIDRALSQKK